MSRDISELFPVWPKVRCASCAFIYNGESPRTMVGRAVCPRCGHDLYFTSFQYEDLTHVRYLPTAPRGGD